MDASAPQGDYFDALETRSRDAREAAQFAELKGVLTSAQQVAPGWRARLNGVDLSALTDRAALARLPLLRKSELAELQAADPPLAGLSTRPAAEFPHLFMSPGPIFEPGGDSHDWWRFGRAMHAAGFRKGQVLHNCFAYHLTPAGQMFENGARAIGCAVLAGGVGATEQQVQAAARIRPAAYSGTPDYLKALLDKAAELGLDLSSYRHALVSGGALFPSLRQEYAERGVACLQCYATADVGLIAYETMGADGQPNPGMIVDEGAIVEIVRPGTGDPVAEGEVGEVVVTNLNPDYPMLRLATGDLSAALTGEGPCGRTNMRIKGWMGRADQRTKIKGMFVDPAQVAALVKRHPEILRARVVVSRQGEQDAFKVLCETADQSPDLAAKIAESAAAELKLRGAVELVEPDSLPNDGKVIEDARDYSS